MPTYAIGDIQGCFDSFQALLELIEFQPSRDALWIAGDIVNRGPQSLQTLRFLHQIRHSIQVVLGNHDLHLLAVAHGHHQRNLSDTFNDILEAPDREVLLEWLRQQPLLHHDEKLGYVLVHAGIPPQWTLDDAISHANEVALALKGNQFHAYMQSIYGNEPCIWSRGLSQSQSWRVITNYFTRMRFCDALGHLNLKIKVAPWDAPAGLKPWFSHHSSLPYHCKVIFGHWAALEGKADQPNVFPMDTGCVWGGRLTAMRLEDKAMFSVESLEKQCS